MQLAKLFVIAKFYNEISDMKVVPMDAEDKASVAAWYALAVLFVAYTVSFIDRSILSLLVEPIKASLGLSDTEISLLHGFAFAIFYTFLGIPIARLADHRSRKRIIALGIVVWSLATAVCGLTARFATLFLARVGVGVGEAALSPAAYSMLTDFFPKRQLGLAMGLYSTGVYVGAGIAFLIGGLAVMAVQEAGSLALPLVGSLEPWRFIFILVGLPGLLVAALMMTVREPNRKTKPSETSATDYGEVFRFIKKERPAFLHHFIGFSIIGLLFNGFLAWVPTFYIRQYGMSAGEIGPLLGLLLLIFGSGGIVAGGVFSDRLIARGDRAGPLTAAGLAGFALLPFAVLAPIVENFELGVALFAGFFFLVAFPYGAAAAAIQMAAPPHLRAQVSAIYLFVLNLAGIGFGPTAVALFTDEVFADQGQLGWSLALVGAICAPLAGFVLIRGRSAFSTSVEMRNAGQ